MLRNPGGGVNDIAEYFVVEVVECSGDCSPGVAFVVRLQILHILQQQNRRPMFLNDGCQMKEQCSLRPIFETVFAAETFFLGNTCQRKRLAGKPGGQHIVRRNGRVFRQTRHVAGRILTEPCLIGLLSMRVFFARKHAATAHGLQPQPQSADSCKQIDEGEGS